jgi:PTH1 family peptidyl-tRNA hydrolase
MADGIRLIVGLGNPGSEYSGTRHNAGMIVLSRLADRLPGFRDSSSGCSSMLKRYCWQGREIWCQWPQTWMNLSGEAVKAIFRREKFTPQEVLVISDDLDLPLGTIRMRRNGSDGGHNGLKSIIAAVGSSDFPRLRVGIGRKSSGGGQAVIDHVLSVFESDEQMIANAVFDRAAEAAKLAIARGVACAMNTYNGTVPEVMEVSGAKESSN